MTITTTTACSRRLILSLAGIIGITTMAHGQLSRPYIETEPTIREPQRPYIEFNEPSGILPAETDSLGLDPEETRLTMERVAKYAIPNGARPVFNGYRYLTTFHMPVPEIEWMVPAAEDEILPDPDDEEWVESEEVYEAATPAYSVLDAAYQPQWLSDGRRARQISDDLSYTYMMDHPLAPVYLAWELPEAPKLAEDDYSFKGMLKRLDIPEVDRKERLDFGTNFRKIHWLHGVNGGVQFSQAYVSPNWYQGGNSYLALLINFSWNVQLNPVYHPNTLFESSLSYKLALNSAQDEFHKYSISQDLFQYNLKTGFKAFRSWFYSFTLQFKTQFLNAYEANSEIRKSGFLSPSELTAGLGMTYNHNFLKDRLKLSLSIAPATYNLKTCIDPVIDPVQYGIKLGRKFVNEGGSSAEMTLDWQIIDNISWKARVFLFSDYKYFVGDWENTLTFTINRFLSTQIYTNVRYDSSSELRPGAKWKHWMLKEILSFGLTYTFSTAG